jgi:integrase/recombinase XerD
MTMPKATWSKCLPVEHWPALDRVAWEQANVPGTPFEPGGLASRWSEVSRRNTALGYGRYLYFLQQRGELDKNVAPASRVTHGSLFAYLEELERTNAGYTIPTRVQELGDAMRALAPERDWGFIKRAAGRLRATTIPATNKRARLPLMTDVIIQGYDMMQEAETDPGASALGQAALYRDGLLLAFLAHHPLRLRNLASLRIGEHVKLDSDPPLLQIEAAETKTRERIEQELSSRLAHAIKTYVERYRPVLLPARGRWHRPVTDELWISRDGSPCRAETFQNIVAKHVRGPDGRPLSPHFFRSMMATTVAIEAPEAVDLIPVVLTHRSPKTGERYYNLADGLSASRAYTGVLQQIEQELRDADRREEEKA